MPKIKYRDVGFRSEALGTIAKVNTIVVDYNEQGYKLSLRQLFYQGVSRNWWPNKESSYDKLGNLVADGRLAGLIDWAAIEDRQRGAEGGSFEATDEHNILSAAKDMFVTDRWKYQKRRVEVWVEKAALIGVLERPCTDLSVTYFTTRGYNSATEMWNASQRFIAQQQAGLYPVLLYLGDHDPSGIDMGRDIQERLCEFGAQVDFHRIALNMHQIEEYNPPPNPAKVTDSRFAAYQEQYGDESWEVDALEPAVLDGLIRSRIESYIDQDGWDEAEQEEHEGRARFQKLADNWDAVKEYLHFTPQGEETEHDDSVIQVGPKGSSLVSKYLQLLTNEGQDGTDEARECRQFLGLV